MEGVFEGFATIGAVIAVGFALAHLGVLATDTQLLLSRLAFFVASPALMVTVVSESDVGELVSAGLAASAAAVLCTALAYLALAHWWWPKPAPEMVIGTFSAVYVNAGNLGLPIAAYVLGDAALVAPILLLQLLVLQPIGLAVLDASTGDHRPTVGTVVAGIVTNPLTVGSLVGLILALTNQTLPDAVHEPLALIGDMAVPAMLLAFGVALRLGPRPVSGATASELGAITMLKLVVQPTTAYLIARFAFDLDGSTLYAVTVLAALPTAQNIFTHATRYGRGVVLARDAVFLTTVLSVPAILVITALLA